MDPATALQVAWITGGGALLSAVIAGAVAIVAVIMNSRGNKLALEHATARELGKTSFEFRLRQINEFYGPLLLLLRQNKLLAGTLRQGKGDPAAWRLLDHLDEVMANERDRAIAETILEIDGKIATLLETKGGLVEPPGPPESFGLFLGHYRLLKLALAGQKGLRLQQWEYFPRQLDKDVEDVHRALQMELKTLLNKSEQKR